MNSIFWIILLAGLIFIEIITIDITTIWFAGGALIAFIVSLFLDSLILEIILFFAISFTLLYFTRPIVKKYIDMQSAKTNYDIFIGKEAVVISTVDNNKTTGLVNLEGQDCSARSLDGGVLTEGTRVLVKGSAGDKLIVIKANAD